MRNHGGGGAFKCRACNFTADIRQSLTVHETYHHDPPGGQPKSNNPFERKPRNSPKRYNQVIYIYIYTNNISICNYYFLYSYRYNYTFGCFLGWSK